MRYQAKVHVVPSRGLVALTMAKVLGGLIAIAAVATFGACGVSAAEVTVLINANIITMDAA